MTNRQSTQWKPGQTGNPKGRPPGKSAITKMRESLSADTPEILAGLVSAAKAGDMQAARLILERVLPAIKPVEQPQEIELPVDGSYTDQGRAVVRSVADGGLSPGQGAALLGALSAMVKLSETDDLARRIALIEGALKIKGNHEIYRPHLSALSSDRRRHIGVEFDV